MSLGHELNNSSCRWSGRDRQTPMLVRRPAGGPLSTVLNSIAYLSIGQEQEQICKSGIESKLQQTILEDKPSPEGRHDYLGVYLNYVSGVIYPTGSPCPNTTEHLAGPWTWHLDYIMYFSL